MAKGTIGLGSAREAAERGDWSMAYERFAALPESALEPNDIETFADAAWWLSKSDESLEIRQRAYAAYAADGDDDGSAAIAARLAGEHFARGMPAVASGWLMRAQRHAQDLPEQADHGHLLMLQATVARFSGDHDRALEITERALEIGRRSGNHDVIGMALHTKGSVLIAKGDVAVGVTFLDEAMTSVIAGELSAFFTGIVYCNVISTCLEIADISRASEWNDAAMAWCRSLPPDSPYPGLCRLNRAEIARLQGGWAEAEREAVRASDELLSFRPAAAGQAIYESGEIRRRVGDVAGAERCFERAQELGFDPQPGLGLLRLSQGKLDAAAAGLRLAASGESESRHQRARLLAAQVDVAIAAHDLDAADEACRGLDMLAESVDIPVLRAIAWTARGATQLAVGDTQGALEALRRARSAWQDLRLPYEGARARILFSRALGAAGDADGSLVELRAAKAAFERLGAAPDADAAAAELGRGAGLPRGLTAREAEVLRFVAAGKTNREIAKQLVISEHTVARHLQNMFAKLDVSSRSAATAFAFEHDLA